MLNPVVVTNYFNDLDALLDKLDLKEKPDQIWNCDETGKNFEHQPVKVIAAKEEKSVIGRTSASSSNITIMACVNAAGRTIPPLFVVKGKHLNLCMDLTPQLRPLVRSGLCKRTVG